MTDISDVDPASAGLSQAGIARLDAWNQALCSDERLPNSCTLIARNGHIGYCSFSGHQNPATASTAAKPISQDTIFRYYSMTKPIVSLALMMLHDDAAFQLNDPVKLYIPAFDRRKMRVLKEGSTVDKPETVPCETDITVKQLLTHTSGLSYGFDPTGKVNVVDGLYHRAGLGSGGQATKAGVPDILMPEFFDRLAAVPLMFQPGEHWAYGLSTDVCGYLVELLSGVELEEFLERRIFTPLGMVDTSFHVPKEKAARFASNFMRAGAVTRIGAVQSSDAPDSGLRDISERTNAAAYLQAPKAGGSYKSGGGGLVGTMHDYYRFCACLLNGGELDGERIISNATIKWMATNHLIRRDGEGRVYHCDIQMMGHPGYTEIPAPGSGFGLGFSVNMAPEVQGVAGNVGNYAWGGAASTAFWIDPVEKMIVIYMTQFMFRDDAKMPLRPQLASLAYGAIADKSTVIAGKSKL